MPRDAVGIIKAEHRSVGAVLDAAKYLIDEIRANRLEPDFRLWWAILYYFEQFPEGLHHPKEDGVLFARVRQRTDAANDVLHCLQEEHRAGQERVRALQVALGHYQANVPGALDQFAAAIDAFANFNGSHMKTEEAELIPVAERHLDDADWELIAQAFRNNDDPMFGGQRDQHFRQLFRNIVNMAPPPIGLGV